MRKVAEALGFVGVLLALGLSGLEFAQQLGYGPQRALMEADVQQPDHGSGAESVPVERATENRPQSPVRYSTEGVERSVVDQLGDTGKDRKPAYSQD